MLDPGECGSLDELITEAIADAQPFADTVRQFGTDSPTVAAALDLGLSFRSTATGTHESLEQLRAYRGSLGSREASAWMDNTTLLTASTLISEAGREAMTPLTIWDLVTFARAAISYERIYHHVHPEIDDAAINSRLREKVLHAVPLPTQPPGTPPLHDSDDGPSRFMYDLWFDAHNWLKRLAQRANTATLDGVQLGAVREAWSRALNRPDLEAGDIVDWEGASTRWISPSRVLLIQMANATDIESNYMYIDPTPPFQELARLQAQAGVQPPDELSELLTDLNLRAYINQRLADFFGLPYVCGAGRVPFRKHLYDRAVAVQHRLTALDIIDDQYAALAGGVQLRLPVFLALAVRHASDPDDIWDALVDLRTEARRYRASRTELDAALARRDLDEVERVGKALTTDIDSILAVAGRAVATAGIAVVEEIAKGDVTGIAGGVAAVEASAQGLLESSVVDRLRWRLRRPYLLWLNDVMDEARHLTEALPHVARVWRIPERELSIFSERFRMMATLQAQ
jgi:hypothetical protein